MAGLPRKTHFISFFSTKNAGSTVILLKNNHFVVMCFGRKLYDVILKRLCAAMDFFNKLKTKKGDDKSATGKLENRDKSKIQVGEVADRKMLRDMTIKWPRTRRNKHNPVLNTGTASAALGSFAIGGGSGGC